VNAEVFEEIKTTSGIKTLGVVIVHLKLEEKKIMIKGLVE